MVTYRTVFGRLINFGDLTLDLQSVALQILALAATHSGNALDFAQSCIRLFRPTFVRTDSYRALIRGPVGEVYRSCFYRIYANTQKKRSPEEFLVWIRHNPLRILYDLFLDGTWHNQEHFAESTGLNSSQVARIFANVLEGDCSGEISVQRLSEALRKLNVTLTVSDAGEPGGEEVISIPTAPTGREWFLILVISAVTKALYNRGTLRGLSITLPLVRDVLARYLAFLFGIRDYNHLNDLVYRVLRELLATNRLSPEVSRHDVLAAVINPDETSFVLETIKPEWVGFLPLKEAAVEDLLPNNPGLSEAEREALGNLDDSEWARVAMDGWNSSRDRVARWSPSVLAKGELDRLLKELENSLLRV